MKKIFTTLANLLIFSLIASADSPTPSPDNSSTDTDIDLKIDKETKEIKIIRSSNDTRVVSKIYKLKYANPWDLKPLLQSAVGATPSEMKNIKKMLAVQDKQTGQISLSYKVYELKHQK